MKHQRELRYLHMGRGELPAVSRMNRVSGSKRTGAAAQRQITPGRADANQAIKAFAEVGTQNSMLIYDEPMAKHTTWRVGGPARYFFRPADVSELSDFLGSLAPDEPLLWLGLGSNLLVRDGGFRGTVIATMGRLNEIEIKSDNRMWLGAGATCAQAARIAARNSLCGAAFLSGIPGTMGGALAMNAGAFGEETWRRVVNVQVIDRSGMIASRMPSEYKVGYREVVKPMKEWFIGCELQLEPGDVEVERVEMQCLLAKRMVTQPVGKATAGSTFRNPAGDFAARLIETAGLKGFAIGGAMVSPKHANFIINTGSATADNIEQLIKHIQSVVKLTHDMNLKPEVHIVGDMK